MVGIKSPSDTEIKQDMLLYFFPWSNWSDREFSQGISYLGLNAFNPEAEPGGCTSTEFWGATAACYKPTVPGGLQLELVTAPISPGQTPSD